MGRADTTEKPELIEPRIVDCELLTGAEPSIDAERQMVMTVGWALCPAMNERRLTLRVAASRAVAEEYCRKLMAILGIKERGH